MGVERGTAAVLSIGRVALALSVLAFSACIAEAAEQGRPFSFDTVVRQARALAARPYAPPDRALPPELSKLDYVQYANIIFAPRKALWRDDLPFRMEMFPRGYIYPHKIEVYTVADGRASQVWFSTDMYEFRKSAPPRGLPADFGFAGLRLLYQLNRPGKYDEVISFLGASYFRALGAGNVYGASSRGLGVDMALPDRAEEFPFFRTFWVERPEAGARTAVVYALLDGPSLAGAYRFEVAPGQDTTVTVQAHLFPRRRVQQLCVAPLTSMFLVGAAPLQKELRGQPQVHDSDGLLVENGDGEWIWRPLGNGTKSGFFSFQVSSPRGFGLMQRNRDPADYLQTGGLYSRRPSVWVEPLSDWGRGAVHLMELNSHNVGNDNVDAFFVPADAPAPGSEMLLPYRLHFSLRGPAAETCGKVRTTRWVALKQGIRFTVAFRGVPPSPKPEVVATTTGGGISDISLWKGYQDGEWVADFTLAPDPGRPSEMRAFLKRGDNALTETWSYPWIP